MKEGLSKIAWTKKAKKGRKNRFSIAHFQAQPWKRKIKRKKEEQERIFVRECERACDCVCVRLL